MPTIDLVTLLLFTALIFICGMSFSRSGSNVKSYFAAGGSLPWWMSGLSLFMSFFSAGTFVVWGSIAYTSGWVAVTIQWTMSIAGLVIGLFIAPRWHKTRAMTAAQFISERLGPRIQQVYTYLFLLISMFTTGAFLYPVAKIVEVSTGIPIYASILCIGVLILIYTATGGLWAVIVTDVLQFVVLTAAVFIVVPLALDQVGGLGGFIEQAPADLFELTNSEYTWGFMLAFGLYNLFFIAGNWAYVQRYTSVSTPKDAQKVGWLFSALYIISPVIWMLPPMIYRTMNPSLEGLADEGAYLLMCQKVLPVGMMGLMIGGMVFATSSSVNTTLNISAGVLTHDLYRGFFPKTSSEKLLKIGRLSTVILGLITIVVALLVPAMGGIVEVVMGLAAVTGGAMFLPPIWALFSKRLTGRTALVTTLVALVINGFFKFIMPHTIGHSFDRMEEMSVGVGIPLLLLTAFEAWGYFTGGSTADYDQYQATRTVPVQEDPLPTSNSENRQGVRVFGMGTTATGVLIFILALMGNESQLLVGSMGILITLLGSIITLKNKR
ncbi:sodium:solute symporter family protein [Pontibacter sp. G13]|uniref:sodium:solute symporter family protein n=1 Tax=Pontibacter sp. G13 TaxID=3074898 RepID=UPI0028896C1D|nr:sodium:solute symporter family protein [Pontibacter sp. G13]WNJ16571.1 sodium:solute symporter family protein [Pontibacter sp. G13]